MMAQVINLVIEQIPVGKFAAVPIQYALYYWSRMSEFTADRAGWLCCQNLKAVVRAFIKIAGLPINQYENINERAFIEQAQDFEMLDYENMNKIIKFITIADQSHPWTVMRGAQLLQWINSGEGKEVLLKHW